MTREEILKMPAGEIMNGLIAEKVCKWGNLKEFDSELSGRTFSGWIDEKNKSIIRPEFWSPSENIADAWEITEIFSVNGWEVTIEKSTMDGLEPLLWRCWLNYFTDNAEDYRHAEGEAETAQLAICRAALLATIE